MSWLFLFAIQTPPPLSPPNDPIVVKIIEPPHDPTGLAEVLMGAARLTGVWALVAIGLGAALAYGLFRFRSREQ